jgi:hypothetical protein
MRDGFPALMLVGDETVSFLEIKAEGDVIRRNQLTRLRQLQAAGITAEIGRVDYRFDPDQDYVVVDIETTGGWPHAATMRAMAAAAYRAPALVTCTPAVGDVSPRVRRRRRPVPVDRDTDRTRRRSRTEFRPGSHGSRGIAAHC